MRVIREYKKAESLEEAWQLNQKKSNRVLGGMVWLKMGKMPNVTPLPQISHLAISCTSNPWENRRTNPDGHSPYNIRCGPKLQGENGKKPKFFEIRLIFPEQFGIIDFVKIGMR